MESYFSGWRSIARAPLFGELNSLLALSLQFCRLQVARGVSSGPQRVENFLRGGQMVSRVSQAMQNAASPEERHRIQRAYENTISRVRNMNLPDSGASTSRKTGSDLPQPRSALPGGRARMPSKRRTQTKNVRSSTSRRWGLDG